MWHLLDVLSLCHHTERVIPPDVDRRLRQAMRDQAVERMTDDELVYALIALHEAATIVAKKEEPCGFVADVLDSMTPVIGSVLARFAPGEALEAGLRRYENDEPRPENWASRN